MKRLVLSMIAVSALVFTSCSDDPTPDPNNVVAPATYVFERDGSSTVSYSGQTTRLAMAKEMLTEFKVKTNTEDKLDKMFAHVEGANDFGDANLNASGKNIRSKTAASADYFSANTVR